MTPALFIAGLLVLAAYGVTCALAGIFHPQHLFGVLLFIACLPVLTHAGKAAVDLGREWLERRWGKR